MPKLSVWFIRLALIQLANGFTLGALLLFNKGVSLHPQLWRLLPLHIELMLTGWVLQLAMGVTHWILPRHSVGEPRGNELPVWLALVALNAGVAMVSAGSLAQLPWLMAGGRAAELLAVLLFAWQAWRRVRQIVL